MFGVTERIAGLGIFKADDRADAADKNLFYFFAVICVHAQNTPDALFFVARGIEYIRSGVQLPRVNPKIGELAYIRIALQLKCERRKRFFIARMAKNFLSGFE